MFVVMNLIMDVQKLCVIVLLRLLMYMFVVTNLVADLRTLCVVTLSSVRSMVLVLLQQCAFVSYGNQRSLVSRDFFGEGTVS